MPLKLIRLPEVMNRVTKGRTTIYRWMDEGAFPKPINLGPNSVAWLEGDIDAWIMDKAAKSGRTAA